VSKPILTESKSVFAPRGTATYTPKWSIVVLAVACLGVLKFNGPGAKTSAAGETPPGETAAAALLLPPVQNKLQTNPPPTRASGGHEKDQIVTVRVKGALVPAGKHVGFRAVRIDDEKSKNQ
jgi:hypothetical protein